MKYHFNCILDLKELNQRLTIILSTYSSNIKFCTFFFIKKMYNFQVYQRNEHYPQNNSYVFRNGKPSSYAESSNDFNRRLILVAPHTNNTK